MYWALRRTAGSALLLTEPWSLLASSGIFNADIFETALFWQVLSNKILNPMGSSSMEEKWAGYSQFCLLRIRMARANCGHSLSARADHQSASSTQKASRSDTRSTRKHGWHSIFTLSGSGYGMFELEMLHHRVSLLLDKPKHFRIPWAARTNAT